MNPFQDLNEIDNYPINLSIQWHITTKCSNRCKHCYMYEEKTFENEKNNTLSLKDLIKILDDLSNFEKKYKVKINRFSLSGGDPLLREDAFEFFQEVRKRNIRISIMGNPETLNETTISKLKSLDITSFQMSLDGLEKTHDFFRSKGSFKRTIEKTKLLKEHGIRCNIMFTLYPANANELIPLMHFVTKNTEATSFSFNVGCYVGEGKNLSKNFTSEDFHKIFSEYLKHRFLLEKEYNITFHERSNFLKILRLEKSLITQNFTNETPVISGCLIGWNPPAILSDGSVLVCRSLPIIIGKLPKDSFENIYLNNPILKKFRRRSFFDGCKECDLYTICRGCPSLVHSITGNPFSHNPICFRQNLKNKQQKEENLFKEPDLNTTTKEEWEYIKSYHFFRQNYLKHLKNKECQFAYLELAQNKTKKRQFLKNPEKFIKEKKYVLSQQEISWLKFRFGEHLIHKNYNIKIDSIAKYAAEKIIDDIND